MVFKLVLLIIALRILQLCINSITTGEDKQREAIVGDIDSWFQSGKSLPLSDEEELKVLELFQCQITRACPLQDGNSFSKLIENEVENLRRYLILNFWLRQNGWNHLHLPFRNMKVTSLQGLSMVNLAIQEHDVNSALIADLLEAKKYLSEYNDLNRLETLVWEQIQEIIKQKMKPVSSSETIGSMVNWFRLLFYVAVALSGLMVWNIGISPVDLFWGVPLHKAFTKVTLPEDIEASNTKTIRVQFFDLKGNALNVGSDATQFSSEARHDHRIVNSFVSQGGAPNELDIVFTSKEAGRYFISLKCQNHLVRGFPTTIKIEEGSVSPVTTSIAGSKSSTIVFTLGSQESIMIEPKDQYGNQIKTSKLPDLTKRFSLKILRRLGNSSKEPIHINFIMHHERYSKFLCGTMAFTSVQQGWYVATIMFDGKPLGCGDLTLIVVTPEERCQINEAIKSIKSFGNYSNFNAELVGENDKLLGKPKSVSCLLTNKQLVVREYWLKFIPKKLYSFRLVPSTKITLVRYAGLSMTPVLMIQDTFQNKPHLMVTDGNVLAASFYELLLQKIGGSESFKDKQSFFNSQLLHYHYQKGHKHTRLPVEIDRHDIMASTLKATRWFGESHWARMFEISFIGETGIDQGGVRREWIELLCKKLFHPGTGLFIPLEENAEALIPNFEADGKLKLFKFAGKVAGKCLYESAHGVTYRHHLPVRLAKSFLTQLVGLRVHFNHFADDAPSLYASKIKFIKDNSVEGLEMTFTDDVFSKDGRFLHTVELKPGGSKIAVTDDNKIEYLDLLAQYRLALSIRTQTESFLSGIQQFVPDSLLSLFDEHELELLLCGVREYDLNDLKKHHAIVHNGISRRTVEWFWQTLSSFSPEQFARLLQFTTGSSQLPHGGFGELKPHFQISSSLATSSLPTAHTCFNMICLPEHNSFSRFERALLTAINEGGEGFGFA